MRTIDRQVVNELMDDWNERNVPASDRYRMIAMLHNAHAINTAVRDALLGRVYDAERTDR